MNSSINDRFKSIRLYLNMSQEKFGSTIGLSKSGISTIESNSRKVTEKHIKLICATHNINEEWFKTGKGDMFSNTDDALLDKLSKKFALSDLQKKVIAGFLKLSDEQRSAIISAIQVIASEFLNSETKLTPSEEEEIDIELENIRHELIAEKKAQRVSQNTDSNGKKCQGRMA